MLTVDDCFHSYHRDDFYLAVDQTWRMDTPEFLIVNAILIIKPIFLVMLHEVEMYLWKCHHHDLTLLSYASPHFQ